jgi:hypothetical protein
MITLTMQIESVLFCMLCIQDATIDELFKVVEKKTGIPPDKSRLIHNGEYLWQGEGLMISKYPAIAHNSTLIMVIPLLSCKQCPNNCAAKV